jgi:hypothetical protein
MQVHCIFGTVNTTAKILMSTYNEPKNNVNLFIAIDKCCRVLTPTWCNSARWHGFNVKQLLFHLYCMLEHKFTDEP